MKLRAFSLGVLCVLHALCAGTAIAQPIEVLDTCEVGLAWSGHPVNYAVLTQAPHQFVAFYDEYQKLVVAQRKLGECTWTRQLLDETVGWDSHNHVVMALDSAGYLHVSGNMHISPLVYFMSKTPFDVTTLERKPSMTGTEELKVTYPKFFTGPDGALLFMYRNGQSGAGDQVINRYDAKGKFWSRLTFKPLLSGDGARNPYLDDFQMGKDGYAHVCWVWRETADAATTNTICYARSKDMRAWESIEGVKLQLPIRKDAPVVVDPVPPGQGMVNGNVKLGFGPTNQPVILYHKNDDRGTQIHAAGWNGAAWVVSKLTDYDYTWRFEGGGTLVGEMGVRRPETSAEGVLSVQWNSKKFGTHRVALHPETLAVGESLPPVPDGVPRALRPAVSPFPEMQARFVWDTGETDAPGTRYLLRWEALPANRDQERTGVLPGPSTLAVHKVSAPVL